jgi:hypothetical protein
MNDLFGQRESGTARLDEAVTAFRAALQEWTRERVPLDWAMTQNNLGASLQTLGKRESGNRADRRSRHRLSRGAAGKDPRARAARLGRNTEQPRQRADGTGGARERHPAARRGGGGMGCMLDSHSNGLADRMGPGCACTPGQGAVGDQTTVGKIGATDNVGFSPPDRIEMPKPRHASHAEWPYMRKCFSNVVSKSSFSHSLLDSTAASCGSPQSGRQDGQLRPFRRA